MADRVPGAAKDRGSFIKLDELLRVTKGARKRLIDEEHRPEAQIETDEREFRR